PVDLGQIADGNERGPTARAAAQDEPTTQDSTSRQGIDAVPEHTQADSVASEFHHSRKGQVALPDPVEEDNSLAAWVCAGRLGVGWLEGAQDGQQLPCHGHDEAFPVLPQLPECLSASPCG